MRSTAAWSTSPACTRMAVTYSNLEIVPSPSASSRRYAAASSLAFRRRRTRRSCWRAAAASLTLVTSRLNMYVPNSMYASANAFSAGLAGVRSPRPTVVIVTSTMYSASRSARPWNAKNATPAVVNSASSARSSATSERCSDCAKRTSTLDAPRDANAEARETRCPAEDSARSRRCSCRSSMRSMKPLSAALTKNTLISIKKIMYSLPALDLGARSP
mmetsp:Transcript_9519/g.25424  ORF Transcript_9519/g.25424 Transcript_9519/m.25424 type:complete len:217 (-) Transcript_9519:492-1142(-)